MFKFLAKRNIALNTEIDQGGKQVDRIGSLIVECHLVDRVWFCIKQTKYPTRTFFNQYSRKYIKMINQLVGHVYSLLSLVMANHAAKVL